MKTSAFLGTIVATLLVAGAAQAAKTNFTVDLSPDQENVTPQGTSNATQGSAKMTFDDVTKTLCGEITYAGLTGAATGMHLHQAPAGDPEADGTPAEAKLIMPVGASPVKFNFKLTAAVEKSLINPDSGDTELYLNIHTAMNTAGEMRSQTPWTVAGAGAANEVTCGAPTNPDGGVSTSSSSGGTDGGSTSSSSSSSSSGDTSSSSGATSSSGGGNDASTSKSTPPDAGEEEAAPAEEGGCNAAGTRTNALSLAFVLGAGIAAISSRVRRKKPAPKR